MPKFRAQAQTTRVYNLDTVVEATDEDAARELVDELFFELADLTSEDISGITLIKDD